MKALTGVLLIIVIINSFGYIECQKCQVCVDVLNGFKEKHPDVLSDITKSIETFKKYCPTLKGRQRVVCGDMGGEQETSASSILKVILTPLGFGKPAEKICEDIGKISDICSIKYEEIVDLSKENVEKLKVKQLKAILRRWGETCEGCLEKKDYVDLIKKLMPKYVKDTKAGGDAKNEL